MSARQETFRKFVEGLPASTGKSLDQWKKEIEKNGPPTYRERMVWLQGHHKIPYRPACIIALQAQQNAVNYMDEDSLLETMYAGGKAKLRPIYERLMEVGRQQGEDVSELTCKTFVSLKRKHVFMQIKPTTRERVDLGLALPKVKATARLIETGGAEKGDRITYRIPLSSEDEIDEFVLGWIGKAYEGTAPGK